MGSIEERTCQNSCPDYLICERLADTAFSLISLAEQKETLTGVSIDGEDELAGVVSDLLEGEEFSADTIQGQREEGGILLDAARSLQSRLVAACPSGKPSGLSELSHACQSGYRGAIDITELDLIELASDLVSVEQ